MSYRESECVCNECGKFIDSGCPVFCDGCWAKLENKIEELESKNQRLHEEVDMLRDGFNNPQ